MINLEDKFDQHIAEDRAHFQAVNSKLDQLLVDVATIKGQWKLVGAVLGTIAGIASGWLWG